MKIDKFKTQTVFQNKQRKQHVQESLQQSRSNIEMYWTTKIGLIQTQNDK